MDEYLKKLNWRYATKMFDASKKLSEEQINFLLTAAQQAPSSYGLQPWKFVVVTNPELRTKLRIAAYNQPQITDASHLIVLCTQRDMTPAQIQKYVDSVADTRGMSQESLAGLKGMMENVTGGMTTQQRFDWNKRQVYLALGFLMSAAALQEIDTCPMEGFDAAQFDEILGLKGTDYAATVLCPVGFRDPSDKYIDAKKVRYSLDEIVEWKK